MDKPKRVLSLDIPWGKSNVVGIAYFDQSAPNRILVSAASGKKLPPATGFDELEASIPEVKAFVDFGASPKGVRPQDLHGPFGKFPSLPQERRDYLKFLHNAFVSLRSEMSLEKDQIDIATVDLPLVTDATIQTIQFNSHSTFRPVERAFASKIMIPGASTSRTDGLIQFARFQPGVHNGCRPGHAVFALAKHIFRCDNVIESFPQLSLGALAEHANENEGTLIAKLAGHKSGNRENLAIGQRLLGQQLAEYLGDIALVWINHTISANERGDAFDAVLGILPALELTRHENSRVRNPVILRNVAENVLAVPMSTGAGKPTQGARDWITDFAKTGQGLIESGILALDISLWG